VWSPVAGQPIGGSVRVWVPFFDLQILQTLKFKRKAFPMSKNTQAWLGARFECFEQLSQLGHLQIPNKIHVINFGTDSNLNLL
jgi:hypothetical protein